VSYLWFHHDLGHLHKDELLQTTGHEPVGLHVSMALRNALPVSVLMALSWFYHGCINQRSIPKPPAIGDGALILCRLTGSLQPSCFMEKLIRRG